MDPTIVVAALALAGTAVTGWFGWLAARQAILQKTRAEEAEKSAQDKEASRQRIASMYERLDEEQRQMREREQQHIQWLTDELARERQRGERLQERLDEKNRP